MRRLRMAEIVYMSTEDILEEVEAVVKDEGTTLEEFIAEGKADILTNARLRDLWLTYEDWIV